MSEESLVVTRIKSDSKYFFRYAKKFSVCASEIGPLYDKRRNLLTSDRLEMCAILLEQFNSVSTTPHPNKQYLIQMFSSLLNQLHVRMMNCSLLISPLLNLSLLIL